MKRQRTLLPRAPPSSQQTPEVLDLSLNRYTGFREGLLQAEEAKGPLL